MASVPPATTRVPSALRLFALLLVVAVTSATALAIARAQQTAEHRREAQVQLSKAEALTHEARNLAELTTLAEAPQLLTERGDGVRTMAALLQASDQAKELGTEGPAMDEFRRRADTLLSRGTVALAAALRGDDAAAKQIRERELLPSFDAMLTSLKSQALIEDRRAADATTTARLVLIGGILLVLALIAATLRFVDLTGRRGRAEELLRRQAYTDPLTALPNRAAMERAVDERLSASHGGRPGEPRATLALLDLDDLKTINDSLGHGRGDDIVRTIGARIAATVGPHDIVCRFGGDEFALLFADPSQEAALDLMDRVLAAIHRPVLIEDRDIRISASAGIATGTEREALMRDADVAMYHAKGSGKDRVAAFDQSMRDNALVNLELTADLRRALSRDELFLEYQPIVDLRSGAADGVEALVRWDHPVHGRIPPPEFVGIAERTGLIGPLGWWVMRTACLQMRTWLDHGQAHAGQHVSVNVSPLQLAEPDVARRISMILHETALDPHHLQLEITESTLVDEPEALVADLTELMSIGVRIAIDDFGTGHSVLAYLRDLPVDVLKIDKAFVDKIESDPSRARLTTGIAQLAQALNLTIVAEGIEKPEQARMLRDMGDLYGQGYLFSRPVSAHAAGKLLRQPRLGPAISGSDLSEVALATSENALGVGGYPAADVPAVRFLAALEARTSGRGLAAGYPPTPNACGVVLRAHAGGGELTGRCGLLGGGAFWVRGACCGLWGACWVRSAGVG